MLDELLFPAEAQLSIRGIESSEERITISICSVKPREACPGCGTESDHVHSIYQRRPFDLPFFGQAVRLCAQVRRFFCDNPSCGRKTFAEQFGEVLKPKARRTDRLKAAQTAIAFALGGEAGRGVCERLGMAISGDTLLRAIRQAPEPEVQTPRVLGIDDWAKRKGQDYGTILVDLETQQPVDMLDSRTVDAVVNWFTDHPGVKMVSRDRGNEYIKGVSQGAPEAEPIADRWHLLSNLREALVTVFEQKPAALSAAAQPPASAETSLAVPSILPESGDTGETQPVPGSKAAPQRPAVATPPQTPPDQAARAARRQARFEQVHAVYEVTGSIREVARQLNMSRRAVKRYLNAEQCPQYPKGRIRHSKLFPYLKRLEERWQAGCTNASQLWRELRDEGFTGSRGLVARWAAQQRKHLPQAVRYRRQQDTTLPVTVVASASITPWSAKRASWLIVKKPPDLDDDEKEALDRLIQADPEVAQTVDLARQFMAMVRQRLPDKLDKWLSAVKASGIAGLISFANGLQADLTAVRNALRYPFSNGQTEGQVNRLKFLKRQMYGRAKFDLLRKRVLPRAGPT